MISWDCDLDYDPKHCLPEYSFLRLDDPDARVAQGFNFRYAKYYSDTTRSLVKAYGINFVVLVRGEGICQCCSTLVSFKYPAARFLAHPPLWVSAIHQRSSASASAGRTSIIPIAVTLGSGLGLLVVATVLCDFVVIHFDKRKKLYRAKKYKLVSKRDSCNGVVGLSEGPASASSADFVPYYFYGRVPIF
ncbi:hypothetical protein HPB51_009168 [Rhipicephalus microplus]|uniref:Purinergic receptor n=1 Tax=Rhipicephalus microplus TaxID=6941 RepID=A0A9J6F0Z4_RHIMP|nr:hypothetical protein HPB51_009168 [Rhipicephalus microplus]